MLTGQISSQALQVVQAHSSSGGEALEQEALEMVISRRGRWGATRDRPARWRPSPPRP